MQGQAIKLELKSCAEPCPGSHSCLTGLLKQRSGARQLGRKGVIDKEPELPNLFNAVQKGLIRHCGICDGYEVIDHKIAVIGHGETGLREALFLRTYTSDITLLSLGQPLNLDDANRRKMAAAGIKSIEEPVSHVATAGAKIVALIVNGQGLFKFDTLYSALGCAARSGLACAVLDDRSCVVIDAHQRILSRICSWLEMSPRALIRSVSLWGKPP